VKVAAFDSTFAGTGATASNTGKVEIDYYFVSDSSANAD